METKSISLKDRFTAFKVAHPGMRIRQIASQLGVSEAELVAVQCGDTATLLKPDFKGILSRVSELGRVMALTRNEEVVHERKGEYLNGSFGAHASLFVGEDIDLRFFLQYWGFAFAVAEGTGEKVRHSFQFFGKDGEAIHKIYLLKESNLAAWEQIVSDFSHPESPAALSITPPKIPAAELPDSEINIAQFQAGWVNLQDTHEFFGLMLKHQVTRTQALRLAPPGDYAEPVKVPALRRAIELAAQDQIPIMVFVGNQGMIQIHTGPVRHLVDHQQWFNIMDPNFNLHINTDGLAKAWVVRKPTADGIVTSIEVFNPQNELILSLFGKRKPGIPELEIWRRLVSQIALEFGITAS